METETETVTDTYFSDGYLYVSGEVGQIEITNQLLNTKVNDMKIGIDSLECLFTDFDLAKKIKKLVESENVKVFKKCHLVGLIDVLNTDQFRCFIYKNLGIKSYENISVFCGIILKSGKNCEKKVGDLVFFYSSRDEKDLMLSSEEFMLNKGNEEIVKIACEYQNNLMLS